jgi:hypothetical protein
MEWSLIVKRLQRQHRRAIHGGTCSIRLNNRNLSKLGVPVKAIFTLLCQPSDVGHQAHDDNRPYFILTISIKIAAPVIAALTQCPYSKQPL